MLVLTFLPPRWRTLSQKLNGSLKPSTRVMQRCLINNIDNVVIMNNNNIMFDINMIMVYILYEAKLCKNL